MIEAEQPIKGKITEPQNSQTRIIQFIKGEFKGPLLIFIGGIHGNEPDGYQALTHVLPQVAKLEGLRGDVLGLVGNKKALAKGHRFLTSDLNRMWTKENIDRLKRGDLALHPNAEEEEMLEIYSVLEKYLQKDYDNYYFIDLHTTSAPTIPFITMNDSVVNRSFCKKFPLPIVIGIEEFLEGPLLSYLNEIGYVGFAFEAGQHTDKAAYNRHCAFVWFTLWHSKVITKKQIPNFEYQLQQLRQKEFLKNPFFEIVDKHAVKPENEFEMEPGFFNFQTIAKGQVLANEKKGQILSHRNARIFMPLYQKQGSDGFFIIRRVAKFWLTLSKYLRKFSFDTILTWLPGIKRNPSNVHSLIVDQRVARFFSNEIFHLLGYRKKVRSSNTVIFTKRDFEPRRNVF